MESACHKHPFWPEAIHRDLGTRQMKVDNITLSGNHFLSIVYGMFNGLSNLFSCSWLLKIKIRRTFISGC